MSRPLPRLAAWLLRVSVPERWSDSITGDFEADWAAITAGERRPRLAAARVTIAAALISARFVAERTAEGTHAVRRDAREAARALRRRPTYAVAAIGVVALGVGLNTSAFAIVDRMLLRPLPYPQPEQLVELRGRNPEGSVATTVSSLDLEAWTTGLAAIASVAGYQVERTGLAAGADRLPVPTDVAHVTPNLLDVLGIPAAVGRTFVAGDGRLGSGGVAVVSADAWRRLFPEIASPVGATLQAGGRNFTVIGVAAAGSEFPEGVGIWLARETTGALLRGLRIEFASQRAVARRSSAATNADIERLGAEASKASGRTAAPIAVPLHQSIVESAERIARLAWAAVGLLFLMACANAAGLLLARIASRRRELETRTALGASRLAIVRHAVVEAGLVAFAGTAAGLLLAAMLLRGFAAINGGRVPLAEGVGLTLSSVLFAAALVGAASIVIAGCAAAALARGGARASTAGGLLVGGQLGLCSALIVSATVAGAGLWSALRNDPGFNADSVLTLTVRPGSAAQRGGTAEPYGPLLDHLGALEGVTSVAMSDWVPPQRYGNFTQLLFEGELATARSAQTIRQVAVTTGFFRTLEIPLLSGRTFSSDEVASGAAVVIVDEQLAERAGGSVLGRRAIVNGRAVEVVGVSRSVRSSSAQETTEPSVYLPLGSGAVSDGGVTFLTELHVLVRHHVPIGRIVPSVTAALNDHRGVIQATGMSTLGDVLRASQAGQTFNAAIFGTLALLGAALSALGVYGLVSYLVQRSTRELGVHIALGATRARVIGLVMRRGLSLAAAGVVAGIAATPSMAALVASRVEGAAEPGAGIYGTVAAALAIVIGTGCAVPAWRAARVDPVTTLKCE